MGDSEGIETVKQAPSDGRLAGKGYFQVVGM